MLLSTAGFLLLLSLQLINSIAINSNEDLFSGVFIPDIETSAADFSAAWLISKSRFLTSRNDVKRSKNMAGATFAVVRNYGCPYCSSVVTRDYFDFFVEHLSSTTNQIPNSDAGVFMEETLRLKETSKLLQNPLNSKQQVDARQNETLAVLIFSSTAFSVPRSIKVHGEIRTPFFEVTFSSVHRYYEHVIVFVQDQHDYDIVKEMKLSAWKIVIMNVPLDISGYATGLLRYSMIQLMDRFENLDPDYTQFKYVYFTEGDQILHMRHQKELYNIIDDSDGTFVVIPHRMNTLPLKQDFSIPLQRVFNNYPALDIQEVELVIEDLFTPRGSCCEDGRYDVAPCSSWWFQCEEWGLRDMMPWFKFGNQGFTMPPATAHRGRCVYSPQKQQCPMPHRCKKSHHPTRQEKGRTINFDDICWFSPTIVHLGPNVTAPTIKPTTSGQVPTNLAPNVTSSRDIAPSLSSVPETVSSETVSNELQELQREVSRLRKKIRKRRSEVNTFKQI